MILFDRKRFCRGAEVSHVRAGYSESDLRDRDVCHRKGQVHLLNNPIKHTIIGPSRAVRHLFLLLALFLFYTIVVAAVDIHYNLKNTTDCIICKFIKNLSCGSTAAASTVISAPEHLQTAPVNVDSSILSKTTIAPTGSRAPPFPPPVVTE
jgi:hypothetical protein